LSRIRGLKRRGSDSEDITKLQDNLAEALSPILSNPILNGVLLKEVELSSGNNQLSHKLGRKPLGWIVVRQRANVSIWDSQDSEKLQDKYLSLEASGSVIVDIIIF
jgi:hypothetical protein